MLLHGKIESSAVNGPGNRAVIWFQGCTLNCPGCWNPGTHRFLGESMVRNEEITTWLMNLEDIDGVTFSGGEPMQHAIDVIEIMTFLKDVRPELSIGMFTGYTQKELESGNWKTLHPTGVLIEGDGRVWTKIAERLDFAVMGRFNAAKVTTEKALCGSSNQDVVLFSDRYSAKDFKPQETQVTISGDGLIKITGYPGTEFIKAVQNL